MRNSLYKFEGATAEVAMIAEGRAEAHAVIHSVLAGESFERQLDAVVKAANELPAKLGMDLQPVF